MTTTPENENVDPEKLEGIFNLRPARNWLLTVSIVALVLLCIGLWRIEYSLNDGHIGNLSPRPRTEATTNQFVVEIGGWTGFKTDPTVERINIKCEDDNAQYAFAINGDKEHLIDGNGLKELPGCVTKMEIALKPGQMARSAKFTLTRYPLH